MYGKLEAGGLGELVESADPGSTEIRVSVSQHVLMLQYAHSGPQTRLLKKQ